MNHFSTEDFPQDPQGGISIRETESLWDEFGREVGLFLRAWKA